MDATDPAAEAVLRLCRERGTERSICPTEAARALAVDAPAEWRRHLASVRAAAAFLARDGHVQILRKGRPIAPADMHGVIRLRLAPG